MKPNAIRLAKEVLSSRRKRADGGTDEWQSTGKLINDDDSVNWGSPDIASDFFRADKEDLRRRKEAEREDKLDRSDTTASIPPPRTAEGRQMAEARVVPTKPEEPAAEAPAPRPAAPPLSTASMPLIPGATPIVEDKFGPMPPAMQATANGFSPANYKEALTDEQRQALALEQWKAAGRSGTPDNPNPAPPANPLVQASLTTPEPKQTATDANREPMRFAPVPGTEPPAPAAAPTSAILAAIRFNESRNKPTAQNTKSSAGGLYQFLDSTWGSVLRRMDPQQYGKFSDRQLRSLKTDPRYVDLQHSAADFMLNKDIAPRLEKAGIPLTPGSAYLSWFQGPAGAVKTYTAPDNATVRQVFPKTVSANSNMRFNGKSYANWTMSDLRQWADTKMAQRMQPARAPLRFGPAEGYEEGGRVKEDNPNDWLQFAGKNQEDLPTGVPISEESSAVLKPMGVDLPQETKTPLITRAQILARLIKSDPEAVKTIESSDPPEFGLADLAHLRWNSKDKQREDTDSDILKSLPEALRWELAGAKPYDKNVMHYDASGGSQIPDILKEQRRWLWNKRFEDLDKDTPEEMITRMLRNQYLKNARIRAADFSSLNEENSFYAPGDFSNIVDYKNTKDPETQLLRGKTMFYPNEHEGVLVDLKGLPNDPKIRDILNDADLRKEYNLSLATPKSSLLHKKSKIFREDGGRTGYANEGAVDEPTIQDQPAVYDEMGNVLVPPQAPEGAKESLYDRAMQSIRPPEDSRIWEGMKRGFGDQPLGGHDRPQDTEFRKEHPSISAAYDSLMKPAAAAFRAPGAILGGLAGTGASAYEAMGAPGGDDRLSPEARTNRLERDLFALGTSAAIPEIRPKAPTYTDAIPRGGDVLPPLPRDALPAPERAAPITIEGNPAALEAPRKALPAPTVVEAAMEKVPERPNPLAEYETIEKFETLNDPVAPAVQKAKEVVQPAFSPVNPEGNLNLRPSITVDQLRGPERQTIDSFLSQLKGKPGFTTDSLAEIAAKFDDPRAVVSKSEFEKAIPASQFEKVDLSQPINEFHVLPEQFDEIVRGAVEDNIADAYYNYFADNYGVHLNRNDLVDLAHFNRGDLSFEDLPQQVRDELANRHITTENDLAANLAEAFDEAYNANFEHYANLYTVYDEDNIYNGKYKYEDFQRLVAEPELNSPGYAEIGVAHPNQRGNYHHYGRYQGDKGLVGHFRRTNLPEGGDLITGEFGMGDYDNDFKITTPPEFRAKPKSTVIEEIQSDVQQSQEQTGPLRQIHGTVFKAAIQDALESGSTTVYMPTAKTIVAIRNASEKTAKTLTRIYDDSIRKEGLQPLSKIPGVTIKKVADGAYHEIDFTPEAVQHILKGPGQRSPGHARGGTVDRAMNVSQFGTDAVQKAVNLARQHRGRPETPRSTS